MLYYILRAEKTSLSSSLGSSTIPHHICACWPDFQRFLGPIICVGKKWCLFYYTWKWFLPGCFNGEISLLKNISCDNVKDIKRFLIATYWCARPNKLTFNTHTVAVSNKYLYAFFRRWNLCQFNREFDTMDVGCLGSGCCQVSI